MQGETPATDCDCTAPDSADLVSSSLVKDLIRPVRVTERVMAQHISRVADKVVTQGVVKHQVVLTHQVSANNMYVGTATGIARGHLLDAAGIACGPENAHRCAQYVLMSTIPVPAVVVAAVDVVTIKKIAVTTARLLSKRSQHRIVSVPKELAEERNIVRRGDDLRGAGIAARGARIRQPCAAHLTPHSASR